MSFFKPNETSSSNSSASSFSMPTQTSPFYRRDLTSSPNSRASSSSMHNHTSSFMSRSSMSSHSQEEIFTASTSTATTSSPPQPSLTAGAREDRRRKVVGIIVPKDNIANEDFYQDKFLTGDIVQRVAASEYYFFNSPFPAGKLSLLEELHNFHESGVSMLTIQVKRGGRQITRRALIVPIRKKKHRYVLQDFEDPSHTFSFDDYTLENCADMQDHGLKLAQEQLSKMRVSAVDVVYPWKQRMHDVNGFSMVYSMLVVPYTYADVPTSQASTLEDAVLQAIAWLNGSKASGVPLIFRSIQTEPIITEDFEQSSKVDLSSIVSSGTYSLQQPRGFTDHRVVIRAIRMWFAFHVAEVKVELEARQGEALLGVTIGRTIEGFCYVTEVVPQTAAYRVGLKERLDAAKAVGMKLVVTKVGNERVLPWFISNGNIRCYDINSISSKLSAYRCAGQAACLHLLDIRETGYPGSMLTSSFEEEGNAGIYMDL